MARIARAVAVGVPHHLTHRGNRRGDVFFDPKDRVGYLALLADSAPRYDLDIWGYCLMTNHVHLLVVPRQPNSMARAIGLAHMRHSRAINKRRGWTGHLWASRFYSTPLDNQHLWTAIKYIELNPVRAGLVPFAPAWGLGETAWSSARAHATGATDKLLDPQRPFALGSAFDPLTGKPMGWSHWLEMSLEDDRIAALRSHTKSGRPLGDKRFVDRIQTQLGRELTAKKRGRKC